MIVLRRKVQERWKAVDGYDGAYYVSDKGSVVSYRFWRQSGAESRGMPRRLTLLVGARGHRFARLFRDGKTTTVSMGKLMLLTFVGADPDSSKKWACHKDGNPAHNWLSNLYWGTNSQNQMDRVAHGTSNRGSRNGRSKITEEAAAGIKERIKAGERNCDIARDFPGLDPSAISAIRIGRIWSHL